jgi:glycosyltransferase involved in cell wall biosynthesis
MKILHLAYDMGGIHTRLYNDIMEAFRSAGHDVTECYLTGNASDQASAGIVSLDIPRRDLKGLRRRLVVGRLRAYIKTGNFDVVITHRRKPAELAAQATRGMSLKGRFAVWHDEGEFDRWHKRWGAVRMFDKFTLIGVSEAVREDILNSGAGFNPQQVIAINNAVDISRLEASMLPRLEARRVLGLGEDDLVLGTIGRLVPKKGHADIIRAIASANDKLPGIRIVIIGGGRCSDELKALVDRHGLEGRVIMKGQVPEAVRYLRAFDGFLLPSYREGLPIALLEAACARLPVICSDIGGNKAVVAGHGTYMRAGDIPSLIRAMEAFLSMSQEQRSAQGQLLHDRVKADFDRPVMMARYQALLNHYET